MMGLLTSPETPLGRNYIPGDVYSGRKKKGDPIQSLSGTRCPNGDEAVVINVDVLLDEGWDMQGPANKAFMWAAMTGRLVSVLGAPPCRTFSAMRHKDKPGFPVPVRSSQHPYGLPILTAAERSLVDKDTAMIAKQFVLYLLSVTVNEDRVTGNLFEHPRDPSEFLDDENDYPSGWRTSMMEEFVRIVESLGVTKVTFNQGALGHPAVKPTTILQNLGLDDLQGLQDSPEGKVSAFEASREDLAS